MGRARLSFLLTLSFNIIYILGFVTGLIWGGLKGMVYAYFIISMIGMLPHFYIVGRLIKLPLKEIFLRLLGIFLAALFMAFFVWLAKENDLATIITSRLQWQLLVYVLFGVVFYIVFCFLFKVEVFFSLMERFIKRVSRQYEPEPVS
jgi:hypothetical protein